MKTSSAKAKGRRFQQWVRDQLIEQLDVHPEDMDFEVRFVGERFQQSVPQAYYHELLTATSSAVSLNSHKPTAGAH